MNKMLYVWIHRVNACDILVNFNDITDAYMFAIQAQLNVDHDYTLHTDFNQLSAYTELPSIGICITQSDSLQIIILNNDNNNPNFSFNNRGFVNVSPDEAIDLHENIEPDGFIPYESEQIWFKETRTHEELDAELDEYMTDWINITNIATGIQSVVF